MGDSDYWLRAKKHASATGLGPTPGYNAFRSGYDLLQDKNIPHPQGTFGEFIDNCDSNRLLCTKVRHGENDDQIAMGLTVAFVPRTLMAGVRRFSLRYYNYV